MDYMNTPFTLIKNQDIDSITIHPPEFQHIEQLEHFFLTSMQDNFSYFPEEAHDFYSKPWLGEPLKMRLEQNKGLLLCAWMNGQIIGLVSGTLPEGGVGTIIWLMVDKNYQNQKIGAKLLCEAKHYYQNCAAHKIKLTVHDEKAMKFYLREGFQQEALHKKHWWKMDFYAMMYFLSNTTK